MSRKLVCIIVISVLFIAALFIPINLQLFPDLPPDSIRIGVALGLFIFAFFDSVYNLIGSIIVIITFALLILFFKRKKNKA